MTVRYMTTPEVAEKWNVSVRAVQISCKNGRVKNAIKFGRDWLIPVNARKPDDHRRKQLCSADRM